MMLRVGRRDGERADGAGRLVVEDRLPGAAGIGGLPDAAVVDADVEDVRLAGDAGGADRPAAAERADHAPLQAGVKIGRDGFGASRRRRAGQAEEASGGEACKSQEHGCGPEKQRTKPATAIPPHACRPGAAGNTLGRLEKPLMPQPVGARLRPGGARMVAGADAEVVGGARVDVQLRRDAGALQGQVHEHAVLGGADDVVPAVRQEDRRRPLRDVQPGASSSLSLAFR